MTENVRCVAHRPGTDEALIVGNGGLVALCSEGKLRPLSSNVDVNLRRCRWNRSGEAALILGNQGVCFLLEDRNMKRVGDARANLRDASWHPREDFALVVGNGYSGGLGGLIPSENVYRFEQSSGTLESLWSRPGTDFIGVDWRPNGESAVLVGYDTIWLTPVICKYHNGEFKEVNSFEKELAPTCVRWRSLGDYALIGTASLNGGSVRGEVFRIDEKGVSALFSQARYFVTCIAWSRRSDEALILGAPRAKAFRA